MQPRPPSNQEEATLKDHRLTKSALLLYLERFSLSLGMLGLLFVGLAYLDSAVASRQAMAAFDDALLAQADVEKVEKAAKVDTADPVAETLTIQNPDQSLWSESRKKKYAKIQNDELPLAVMAIDRLNLQVPVFHGTDAVTLNRGAGIVDGTAQPGEDGNIVVSAHRDGFFRPLKDIAIGDRITMKTLQGTQVYVVKELFITDPLDISVLDPTESPTLTLITCYPFYYVGYAPERLIIRAQPENAIGDGLNDDSHNDTAPQASDQNQSVVLRENLPEYKDLWVLNHSH